MSKKYWLRGIIAGIVLYIIFLVLSYVLIFGGAISCNAFVSFGPGVEESILCGPIITLAGIPLIAVGEVFEDISLGTITNLNMYLTILVTVSIYLGIFALFGYTYGKKKEKNI